MPFIYSDTAVDYSMHTCDVIMNVAELFYKICCSGDAHAYTVCIRMHIMHRTVCIYAYCMHTVYCTAYSIICILIHNYAYCIHLCINKPSKTKLAIMQATIEVTSTNGKHITKKW